MVRVIRKQILNTVINGFIKRNIGEEWLNIWTSHKTFVIKLGNFFTKVKGVFYSIFIATILHKISETFYDLA